MSRVRRVVLAGRVVEVVPHGTVSHVCVEVVPGLVVRSLMPAGAVAGLGLALGEHTCVVVRVDQLRSGAGSPEVPGATGGDVGRRAPSIIEEDRTPCIA